jgi:CheY-like chemotaxis protein
MPMHAPLRILLVDDDVNQLRAAARQLQGYSLRFATDVSSALQELQAGAVDVVLSDYQMPGNGDGIALLEAVRHALPEARRILTSAAPPPYLPELLLSGVVEHFVPKPSPRPLRQVLRDLEVKPQRQPARPRAATVPAHELN